MPRARSQRGRDTSEHATSCAARCHRPRTSPTNRTVPSARTAVDVRAVIRSGRDLGSPADAVAQWVGCQVSTPRVPSSAARSSSRHPSSLTTPTTRLWGLPQRSAARTACALARSGDASPRSRADRASPRQYSGTSATPGAVRARSARRESTPLPASSPTVERSADDCLGRTHPRRRGQLRPPGRPRTAPRGRPRPDRCASPRDGAPHVRR